MSGILEQILTKLTSIEALMAAKPMDAPVAAPVAAAKADVPPVVEPTKRGRGRPVGSTKTEPTPVVQPATSVGEDDSSFLDDGPSAPPAKPPTKDEVRAALVAYNKKVNSEQKTRDLLKSAGGVDNLSALPESKYAAVIAAANAA